MIEKTEKNAKFNVDTNITVSFFLQPTNAVEVEKIMKTLNQQSAGRIDGVSNRVIKTLSPFLSLPYAHIFNNAIEIGEHS